MNKRRPGQSKFTTQRKESDKINILSGVFQGKTTGTPICILINNEDKRSRDYETIKNKFRPVTQILHILKNTESEILEVVEGNQPVRLHQELQLEQLQKLF